MGLGGSLYSTPRSCFLSDPQIVTSKEKQLCRRGLKTVLELLFRDPISVPPLVVLFLQSNTRAIDRARGQSKNVIIVIIFNYNVVCLLFIYL